MRQPLPETRHRTTLGRRVSPWLPCPLGTQACARSPFPPLRSAKRTRHRRAHCFATRADPCTESSATRARSQRATLRLTAHTRSSPPSGTSSDQRSRFGGGSPRVEPKRVYLVVAFHPSQIKSKTTCQVCRQVHSEEVTPALYKLR